MKIKLTIRIWILIFVLIGAAILIAPNFEKGVIIKSVEKNSSSYEQGLRPKMIIKSINGQEINNLNDYSRVINSIFPNYTIKNNTIKNITNNSVNSNITNISELTHSKIKLIINTKNEGEFIIYTDTPLNITVSNIPKTRIKTGLDISGGARALVSAQNVSLSRSDVEDLVSITSNRLNTFGIADVNVRAVSDLSGNNFMLVEVAGATPSDLKDLISKQGKFEAKIGNETVFIGGEEDITYVARTGEQSGVYSCGAYQNGEICNFRFAITLSEKAAKRHADITQNLNVNSSNPEYLDKQLDLYLDDQLVQSLYIGKELKGSETTQISISGSGIGTTRQEAYDNAIKNMKELQTILITGSLPYKLEIVKLDSISPTLGEEFIKNILILALIVFSAISITLFIKYRKIRIALAVILTMFSEALITLAIAALINWNLDSPSIAGIIAGMGTGVNDQILILDEATSDKRYSLKERIKNAFFVILSVFAMVIVAMLPLFWAGAGMLKGFALTTIIGVCVGIIITRPAFADIIKYIIKD
ncbi:MAG: hypothetical protein QXW97_00480 [Candidatus Pacearchaeota archaeon]